MAAEPKTQRLEPAKASTLGILTAFVLVRPSWQALGASVSFACLFPALGSTQTTMATPSLVPYYQFIKANDSDHIYFHAAASPEKHLVRGGRCRLCDHPQACKYIVIFQRSYLDALITATDFTCDMLDDVPSVTAAPTPQKHVVGTQERLLALLKRFHLVVLCSAVLFVSLLLAVCMLQCIRAQQGKRKRTTRSTVASDDSEASDSCDSASTPLHSGGAQELQTPLRPGREFDLVTVTPNGYEVRPLPADFMAAAVPGGPPTQASPSAQPSQTPCVPSGQKALAPPMAAAFSVPTTIASAVPTQAPQEYGPVTMYRQGLAIEAH